MWFKAFRLSKEPSVSRIVALEVGLAAEPVLSTQDYESHLIPSLEITLRSETRPNSQPHLSQIAIGGDTNR